MITNHKKSKGTNFQFDVNYKMAEKKLAKDRQIYCNFLSGIVRITRHTATHLHIHCPAIVMSFDIYDLSFILQLSKFI